MRKAILPVSALAVLLALVLPAGAAAQNVPPGNSAAAQYTESFPTSQGEKDAQGPKKHVDPNKVIGSEKTKKLEAQGPEGAAVAEFTAETAPTASGGAEESPGGESTDENGGGTGGGGNGGGQAGGREGGGATGNGGPSNGNGHGNGNGGNEEPSEAAAGAPSGGGNANGGGSGPSGSSAVGEVASQATGVSSGALGLWLPIVLVGVVAWAAFMFWRRREGSERAV